MGVAVEGNMRVPDAHFFQEFNAALSCLGPGQVFVHLQGFNQLLADGQIGVQTGHWVLENHGNITTPDGP